ncbi:MAG: alanyl-tRNA editing protein [Chloroflexota bacterium]|nr:alanyl-tRNA editing protein [Chloroflexota bacterium]
MRTEPLYALDSSIKEFDTTVLAVEGDEVALAQTAFYPGGGGQPPDTGSLIAGDRTWQVTALRKDGDVLWHKLQGEGMPEVGGPIWGRLDWDRRYLLMRTHTALHILSAIAYRDYGATVTGGNMEPGEGRLDFEIADFTPAVAEAMIGKVNDEVACDREVKVYTLPRDEALQLPDLIRTKTNLIPPEVSHIRIVEIVGLDRQADGGTHVGFTAEVGDISLRGTRSKGASNKRIMIGLQP